MRISSFLMNSIGFFLYLVLFESLGVRTQTAGGQREGSRVLWEQCQGYLRLPCALSMRESRLYLPTTTHNNAYESSRNENEKFL